MYVCCVGRSKRSTFSVAIASSSSQVSISSCLLPTECCSFCFHTHAIAVGESSKSWRSTCEWCHVLFFWGCCFVHKNFEKCTLSILHSVFWNTAFAFPCTDVHRCSAHDIVCNVSWLSSVVSLLGWLKWWTYLHLLADSVLWSVSPLGSDDGHIYIWRKRDGQLVQCLEGDRGVDGDGRGVVNCVQPNPVYGCVILPLLS